MSSITKFLSFRNPVGFFLPYLFSYSFFWICDFQLNLLLGIFLLLHIFFLSYYSILIGKKRVNLPNFELVFFLFLFLILFIPGAYLEYPSDPWEHMRRIFRWQELGTISNYPVNIRDKFLYFWSFSLLSWLPIEYRRIELGLYGSLWQLAICIQIFRLAKTLGAKPIFCWLHPIAFIFLFGTNVFNFRYYALSSTSVSYFIFLELLIFAIIRAQQSKFPSLPYTLAGCLLIYFNHLQELIFVGISYTIVILFVSYNRCSKTSKQKFLLSLFSLTAAGFIAGSLIYSWYPNLYSKMLPEQISFLGSFRIWDSSFSFYRNTLGVHGILAILLCLFFIQTNKLGILLSLAPIFSLIFPPTALIYSLALPTGYLSYRLLFCFPLSTSLLLALEKLFSLFPKTNPKSQLLGAAATSVAVLVLAYPCSNPWWGRMKFHFFQATSVRSLEMIDETASWFDRNRDAAQLRHCNILTDNATKTALSVHLGLPESIYGGERTRRARSIDTHKITSTDEIISYLSRHSPFCGVLVARKEELPMLAPSLIGRRSGHWESNWADINWLTTDAFENAAAGLTKLGWHMTRVPPFYNYYEIDEAKQ